MRKILIIEDDPTMLKILQSRLLRERVQPLIAIDADEGLAKLESELPDMLILDLMLQGRDGIEILRQVKSNPKTKDIPVVVFSLIDEKQTVTEARDLGAADYIVKGATSLSEVISRIMAVLEKSTGIREIVPMVTIEQLKTDFIAIVAHQLRTPLTPIKLLVEMLLDESAGKLTKQQREYLKNIEQSAERLIQLVNEYLDIYLLETGRLAPKLEEIELAGFIAEVVSGLYSTYPNASRCEIVVQKPPQALPMLTIDRHLFQVMVRALIGNALDYTGKNGCKVVVTLSPHDSGILLTISDNGIGIPTDEQPKIFTKFFRGSAAMKARPDGSGLHLYLLKFIIDKIQGGEISFESTPGKGTMFRVFLPAEGMSQWRK